VIAGATAAVILALLGLIHVYWAAGGAIGKGAAIPTRDGNPMLHPTPLTTSLVAIALLALAALIAIKIGWIAAHGIEGSVRAGLWIGAGLFLLRAVGDFRYVGFFKRVRATRFARLDTLIYSPLCLLLAALIAISVIS